MHGVPPVWHRLFKPEPCSDTEHRIRAFAGLATWIVGLIGIWRSTVLDHFNWTYDPSPGRSLLAALFWFCCLVPLLLDTARAEAARPRFLATVILPSEIQALPDLHGFLKPARPWPVVRVTAELTHG